jgi:hypothetical protein
VRYDARSGRQHDLARLGFPHVVTALLIRNVTRRVSNCQHLRDRKQHGRLGFSGPLVLDEQDRFADYRIPLPKRPQQLRRVSPLGLSGRLLRDNTVGRNNNGNVLAKGDGT